MSRVCPFCYSAKWEKTFQVDTFFNKKRFSYIKCSNCNLLYIYPFPEICDYIAMYPPDYQNNNVDLSIALNQYAKLPGLRFSYGFQLELINQFANSTPKIFDYGCGNANFIANAINYGFQCSGAEFNEEYVNKLRVTFQNANFYTINDFINGKITEKFDVIRLSNVLEHLIEPRVVMQKLKANLKQGGVFLIEGPVEENFCITFLIKKVYNAIKFILYANKLSSHPPYHVFFSNKKNQRLFFRLVGLKEFYFKVEENAWPFPANFKEAIGAKRKIMAIIAIVSMYITKKTKQNFGNTFIYIGIPENK